MKYIFLCAALLLTLCVSAQTNTNYITQDGRTVMNFHKENIPYRVELQNDKITNLSVNNKEIPSSEWSKYSQIIEEVKEQIKRDHIQAEKDRKQAELDRIQAEKDRAQAARDREQAVKDRAQAEKDRAQAEIDRKQAEKDREQAVKDRAQVEKDRKTMDGIIADLIHDKVIDSRNDLYELVINKDQMIVNGKKLEAAVYNRYKAKYKISEEHNQAYRRY